MLKVIKRNGRIVDFDKERVSHAILKAMKNGSGIVNERIANKIADEIYEENKNNESIAIGVIEKMVFDKLIAKKQKLTAKSYEGYRCIREFQRNNTNTTDEQIRELLNGTSDYWNNENSNKNARLLTTQRDYMAGIVSTDITRRFLLPPEIVQAHDEGLIHFHDADYFGMNAIHNCSLINLADMLQNGTCINKVKIDKPHRLITATTITTQAITAVTSSQYGGATITLTDLAPFVRDSWNIYFQKYLAWGIDEATATLYADRDIKKEIADSVQTFNYQCNSMTTTNGQSPFLSVFMYLGETNEYKKELAMLIEEFLRQRIIGLKNEVGVYVTQAFPKLLYVLEEDNIHENSPYWYLTKLAAECTAKRMVPDYISEKVIKKLKENNCFPSMGCVDGNEVITYKFYDFLFVESFERMWDRLSTIFEIKTQANGKDFYMDLKDVSIWDKDNGFVKTRRIIKNSSDDWLRVIMSNGRILTCTEDHPFVTSRGRIFAKDLKVNDKIPINLKQYVNEIKHVNPDLAWSYGVLLCDGCYSSNLSATFAIEGEDEIIQNLINTITNVFNIECAVKEWHRDKKGDYKEVCFRKSDSLKYKLIQMFEGISKNDRHIPNEVFTWNEDARYAFMAGMIDADGYINDSRNLTRVQIGSVNKELAIQQMLLAQSLGMTAYMYINHYDAKDKNKVRYRVEFNPDAKLVSMMKCTKKFEKFNNVMREMDCISNERFGCVTSIKKLNLSQYSYDVTTDSDHFDVSGIYSHNCRSFLNPWKDEDGNYKFYGRFNQGVVTLNLVDAALSSEGDVGKFWYLLDQRAELCHKALKCRHERLEGTISDVAPILWQDGAFTRLEKGEKIDKYLHGGYSSISLGYAGLYECVKYMTGKSHTDHADGHNFGIEVMKFLNKKCEEWKAAENIGYSLYGSPIESTTYKFAKCLKKRFGVIEGITDRDYITNSYHVFVQERINAFDKLYIESEFQSLSLGGAISYIETANMTRNISAVLEIIKYIYDNIMYAELNTKSDYCQCCGYDGEIEIIDEDGQLIWECPNCKNRDKTKMNVSRRTCGYIGTNFWNQGRTQEIKERYVHIDDIAEE